MKNAINQGSAASPKKNSDVPINPPALAPNIKPNPKSQNTTEERQKSAKFLVATLMLFLVRTRPLSRQEKPACINMTRAAHTRIQAMSRCWAVVDISRDSFSNHAKRVVHKTPA